MNDLRSRLLFGGCMTLAAIVTLGALLGAGDSSSQNRRGDSELERIESASAEERDELRRKRDQFRRLPESEKDRLRAFHEELENHANRDRLMQILIEYNEWLSQLTPLRRAEIVDLPMEQRIEKIREVREEEARRALGFFGETKLPDDDIPRLYDWIDRFVSENEQRILDHLDAETAEELRKTRPNDRRRRRIAFSITGMELEELEVLVSVSDVESLLNLFSEEAKAILASRESDEDRVVLVQRWIRFALMARNLPRVSDEELQRFYREDLSEDERDQLDKMHPDQMQKQLNWMYHSRRSSSTEGRSGRGGNRSGRDRPARDDDDCA